MKAFERVALNILRIATGLLFMEHGARKLFGWLGRAAVPANVPHIGIAGLLAFIGGLLIVIGLGTRPVAALHVPGGQRRRRFQRGRAPAAAAEIGAW